MNMSLTELLLSSKVHVFRMNCNESQMLCHLHRLSSLQAYYIPKDGPLQTYKVCVKFKGMPCSPHTKKKKKIKLGSDMFTATFNLATLVRLP